MTSHKAKSVFKNKSCVESKLTHPLQILLQKVAKFGEKNWGRGRRWGRKTKSDRMDTEGVKCFVIIIQVNWSVYRQHHSGVHRKIIFRGDSIVGKQSNGEWILNSMKGIQASVWQLEKWEIPVGICKIYINWRSQVVKEKKMLWTWRSRSLCRERSLKVTEWPPVAHRGR